MPKSIIASLAVLSAGLVFPGAAAASDVCSAAVTDTAGLVNDDRVEAAVEGLVALHPSNVHVVAVSSTSHGLDAWFDDQLASCGTWNTGDPSIAADGLLSSPWR